MTTPPDTSVYDAETDVLHIDSRVGEDVPGPAAETRLDDRRIVWHDRDGGAVTTPVWLAVRHDDLARVSMRTTAMFLEAQAAALSSEGVDEGHGWVTEMTKAAKRLRQRLDDTPPAPAPPGLRVITGGAE